MRRGAKALLILGVSIPAAIFRRRKSSTVESSLAWLALYASLAWWTLYTGVLSYVLIATLFAAETVYRYWRFRPYDGSVTDPLFRRIFPPRRSG